MASKDELEVAEKVREEDFALQHKSSCKGSCADSSV
jgi:hypothetical protein